MPKKFMLRPSQLDTEFSRKFFGDIARLYPKSERPYDCAGISTNDGSANGLEYATDTTPDSPLKLLHTQQEITPYSSSTEIKFRIRPEAPDLVWRLMRSSNGITSSEIYRYDGVVESTTIGIGSTLDLSGRTISVLDASPPRAAHYSSLAAAPCHVIELHPCDESASPSSAFWFYPPPSVPRASFPAKTTGRNQNRSRPRTNQAPNKVNHPRSSAGKSIS
jgi:hypothetical protein